MDRIAALVDQKRATLCKFGQHIFVLDARACLYWPLEKILLVSDLHLEKGSYYRRFAHPLPNYDSLDTLVRLQQIIDEYQPETLVCLGDSFHDAQGYERMTTDSRTLLSTLCEKVIKWVWIFGNHDPAIAPALPGERSVQANIKDVWLRHEPELNGEKQVIGHFHPKLTQVLQRRKVTGKTFVVSDKLLIMPAFGSFTGGLDVQHDAIQTLLANTRTTQNFLIAKDQIWCFGP